MKKLDLRGKWGYIIAAIFLFFGVCAFFSAIWYRTVYGDLGFDSVFFTMLAYGGNVESGIVWDYLLRGLLPCIACSIVIGFIIFFKPKSFKLKFYPLSKKAATITCYILCAVLVISGVFISNLSKKLVSVSQKTTFFEEHYVYPESTKITFPEQKRNLIYIYLESMESTFLSEAQGGAMKDEIATPLYELAKHNINFSHSDKVGGYRQLNGCQWTAAGMVSHTTGLPLKNGMHSNVDFSNGNFLPNVKSLMDILKDNGYYQALMVGSDSKYGNRSDFYNIHGIDKIYDIYSAKEDGIVAKDYFVWWGMEDKYLYSYAKQELAEIAKRGQPFSFTMLTADTHFPQGYVCELCENKFENQYENVISCATHQLYDFIEWIKEQPFYENTTIVVVGDHATMDNEYMMSINIDNSTRRIYNCFINSAATPTNNKNRTFTAVDMFPSTLAAIGCSIEGERLGLGTNLFANTPTLTEKYPFQYFEEEVSKESDFYYDTFYK